MSDSSRSTLVNALVGAVAAVVLSFVPFSPVLGGAVAGYLEGRDGLRVGTYAGLFAAVPMALLAFFVLSLLLFVDGGVFVLLAVVLGLVLLYTVGLSAVGGLAGVYLADYTARRQAGKGPDPVEATESGSSS